MYEYKYSVRTMKVDMLPCCEWIPRYAKICRSTEGNDYAVNPSQLFS